MSKTNQKPLVQFIIPPEDTEELQELIGKHLRLCAKRGQFLRLEIYEENVGRQRPRHAALEAVAPTPASRETVHKCLKDIQARNAAEGSDRLSDRLLAKVLGNISRTQIHNLRSGRARANSDNPVVKALYEGVFIKKTLNASQNTRCALQRILGLPVTGYSPRGPGRPRKTTRDEEQTGEASSATHQTAPIAQAS